MDARDHPGWCTRHSAARCRSDPDVVAWRMGTLSCELGAQLEGWSGREVALVLLPESGAPIYLPRGAATAFYGAVGGLMAATGWVRQIA